MGSNHRPLVFTSSSTTELRRLGGFTTTSWMHGAPALCEGDEAKKRKPEVDVFRLPHERQRAHHLPNRSTVHHRVDANSHRLASERTIVLLDQLVGEAFAAKGLGDTPQRSFIRNRERDDDCRRVAGSLGGSMGGLGDLHPDGEVSANQRVEDTGRGLDRRRRRILTVDASCVFDGRAAPDPCQGV